MEIVLEKEGAHTINRWLWKMYDVHSTINVQLCHIDVCFDTAELVSKCQNINGTGNITTCKRTEQDGYSGVYHALCTTWTDSLHAVTI